MASARFEPAMLGTRGQHANPKTTEATVWVGHVVFMEKRGGTCRVLVGKPEGNRPLGKPVSRWRDIVTMYLKRCRVGGHCLDLSTWT
jgi:hypothetical protein